MNGHKRQWVLVVLVCQGLLTLYTANGHPYLERNAETGIRDDPAEMMPLSLVERDAKGDDIAGGSQPSLVASTSSGNVTTTESNTNSVSLVQQQTPNLSTSNLNVATVASNKTSVSKTALPQNVTIIATTTAVATGIALGLTSTRSTIVNMNKTNSNRTLQNAPRHSSIILATSANELKPSLTQNPTGSASLSVGNGVSSFNTPNPRTTVLATKSAQSSVVLKLNPSKSTYSVQPTITSSLHLKIIPTSSAGLQKVPSSNVIAVSRVVQSSPVVRSSVTASQKASSSITTPKLGAPGASTQNPAESTSAQKPSGTSSTEVISKSLSTVIGPKVPSTKVSTSANTKPPSQTSEKLLSTEKQTTLPSTTPQGSSSPSTKENTVAESTSSTGSSGKPTTKITTKKPTIVETKKPSTKGTSSVPSTSETPTTVSKKPPTNMKLKTTTKVETKATSKVTTASDAPTTVPKEPTTDTKAKTTKEETAKIITTTEKTTAEKVKTSNQNNDEGRMPPPDQGKEAVLWDFIVPVAIGTGVALVIAFGVIVVRACRRRRLIKVRFGGKPSHPRLLNNDLINLLAESDDEEEE